jgi:hypothetical protein
VPPLDVRGLGIQAQKLDSDPASSGATTTRRPTLAAPPPRSFDPTQAPAWVQAVVNAAAAKQQQQQQQQQHTAGQHTAGESGDGRGGGGGVGGGVMERSRLAGSRAPLPANAAEMYMRATTTPF